MTLIFALIVAAILLALINLFVTLDPRLNTLIVVVIGLFAILWLMQYFGVVSGHWRLY